MNIAVNIIRFHSFFMRRELMAVQKDYHKFLSKKRIQKEGRTKSAAGMQRRAKTPVNKT